MNYRYATIDTLRKNKHNGFFDNLPAAYFGMSNVHQFISNPEDVPHGLKAGLFVYNPEDQFARFVTEKELNEALSVKNHPLGSPVGHLQAALDSFRKEGLEAKESDPQSSKAAFEDAALVADTIGSIENGLHRGQFEKETLEQIEAGE